MVFFVRSRYYYSYAESLLKDVHSGVRPLTPALALDIFSLGLKALHALEAPIAEPQKLSIDELVQRLSTSLSPPLKNLTLELKEELRNLSPEDLSQNRTILLEKLLKFIHLVREELKPILHYTEAS